MSLLVIYKYIIIYTHVFSNFLMKVVLFYYIDNIFIKMPMGNTRSIQERTVIPLKKRKEKERIVIKRKWKFFFLSRGNQTRFSIMRWLKPEDS